MRAGLRLSRKAMISIVYEATGLVNVDGPVLEETLSKLRSFPAIRDARVVEID